MRLVQLIPGTKNTEISLENFLGGNGLTIDDFIDSALLSRGPSANSVISRINEARKDSLLILKRDVFFERMPVEQLFNVCIPWARAEEAFGIDWDYINARFRIYVRFHRIKELKIFNKKEIQLNHHDLDCIVGSQNAQEKEFLCI
jgi:hypothetical protein